MKPDPLLQFLRVKKVLINLPNQNSPNSPYCNNLFQNHTIKVHLLNSKPSLSDVVRLIVKDSQSPKHGIQLEKKRILEMRGLANLHPALQALWSCLPSVEEIMEVHCPELRTHVC